MLRATRSWPRIRDLRPVLLFAPRAPTLPNRMYSLTGELQRNLYGEPRLENGVDRNMTLSRDPTVFDIL